ncbi:hypothetical protein HanRHA438_Chr04g0170421 [Helianthus annuus]|uniref:Protein FLC EXPRESSOR n=1 Tax=Helianthus annuus TaxID=4232 RepID=A0A251UXJ8_HELAN|nr:protein FLC EXPRESSOR [Helianthus annuus]KAF5809691.1 hypothetical protein HanXRQr2_Chr04g0160231 [Helianthus annuus]KAJ0580670.1 hypothetical protein HanHA300_Chr04g0131931 [Helianthus annuus]KAJ0588306.1 hypothetical protein HanIR_Chr04g0173051 [Helianthus annuus]KAJ0596621.1 hypothetical protein HanHA89_Chr04g0144911 [Helianthus annuus]KAJ0757286.1 hypothetical protein HanLR1_Chr04g0136891 [Helianthus annuus]
MASRDYHTRDTSKPKRDSDSHSRRALESPPRHRLSDDRVAVHHRDVQTLLVDNQRLAATHVALKQELGVALQDLRHLSGVAGKVKAERAAEVREVFEKAVKMEAEVRVVDELRGELVKVGGDVKKLGVENKEFVEKVRETNGEIMKERAKQQEFEMVKGDIEGMKQEIQKGRAAIEYEKKVYESNLEQSEAMEKSRVSMAHEIEKLQADLANAHKKAMAAAAAAATNTPGYAAGYGNHDVGYGANAAYSGPYVAHQVPGGVNPQYVSQGPYDMQHHMVNPHYVPGPVPHGPYDMQHPNAQG